VKTCKSLLSRWNRRLDWAHAAIGDFRDGLSPEVRHLLPGRGESTCNVAVYGRSQVGKTTLILRLMGVNSGEVDRVLRAGRPEGKSSTSTAIFYRRSADDRWHASTGAETRSGLDADQLVHWLQTVRERAEGGEVFSDPVKLFIPSCYFGCDSPPIEILDLPGVDSSTLEEKRHVSAVAEKYLPIMEVVLLVSKANSLDKLFPQDGCGIPFLENWRAIPDRFRFVTTYSLSLQTMRDRFTKEIPLDAGALRSEIAQQSSAFLKDPKISGILADLLFPVDVGTSWHDLRENHPGLHERALPVMEEILAELRATVLDASDEWSRLAAPFSWFRQIMSHRQTVAEEREETIEELDKAIDGLTKISDAVGSSLSETAERAAVNKRYRGDVSRKTSSTSGISVAGGFASCKYVSTLQSAFSKAEREIVSITTRIIETHNEWCRSASWRRSGVIEKHEEDVSSTLSSDGRGKKCRYIRSRLASYALDSYWITSNLESDRGDCDAAISELAGEALEVVSEWMQGGCRGIKRELEQEATSLSAGSKVLQDRLDDLASKIGEKNRVKTMREEEYASRLNEIQRSEDSARKFHSFLTERWRSEMARRWNSLAKEKSPALRLFNACVVFQLHRDMRKLQEKI